MAANRAANNLSSGALLVLVRNMNAEASQVKVKLITTAYHVWKNAQHFTVYFSAVAQQKGETDLGTQRHADKFEKLK